MDLGLIVSTISTITPDRPWGIDIPNYFWFTGSSAAAFIISSFAHVFGMKQFKPIAGFSLLLAFVLLVAAPFNLIDDLRQPGRVLNFFLYGWENFPTSPMKWGVLLLIAYPLLILAEAYVLYKPYFKRNSAKQRTPQEIAKDEKLGFILGAIGIPLAISVHGYTGYILGAVHAIPLFHTPLMPILFLASAMVSGTGLLLIVLPIFQRFFTEFKKIDYEMIARLARLLAWFIVIDLVIRFFWLTFAITFNSAEKYPLSMFFGEHLYELIVVEYILCLLIPMFIGFSKKLSSSFTIVFIGAILSAVGVWLFRWNTVIGGQTIGKTTPFLLEYNPHLFGPDSIFSIVSNWSIFIALIAFVMVLFPWDKEMSKYYTNKKEA